MRTFHARRTCYYDAGDGKGGDEQLGFLLVLLHKQPARDATLPLSQAKMKAKCSPLISLPLHPHPDSSRPEGVSYVAAEHHEMMMLIVDNGLAAKR